MVAVRFTALMSQLEQKLEQAHRFEQWREGMEATSLALKDQQTQLELQVHQQSVLSTELQAKLNISSSSGIQLEKRLQGAAAYTSQRLRLSD